MQMLYAGTRKKSASSGSCTRRELAKSHSWMCTSIPHWPLPQKDAPCVSSWTSGTSREYT
eukprot:CAMPEP_0115524054 /NCGR_PEP_ID=MMETSP0271-20121206/80973_1 /TAXON_ID=71861 /ORGANISM="Scrippsiella trochoidea, Strain CCMP3099" /LENGTH=59 /DNA_ID=CAMNT_0002955523 /DNA_START=327 /DNA_END=506 /DNA_ORIENTATION=+